VISKLHIHKYLEIKRLQNSLYGRLSRRRHSCTRRSTVGTDNAEENWQITSQDLGLKPDRPFSVRTRILLEICGREWNENRGFFSRSNDHCLPFHRDLKNPSRSTRIAHTFPSVPLAFGRRVGSIFQNGQEVAESLRTRSPACKSLMLKYCTRQASNVQPFDPKSQRVPAISKDLRTYRTEEAQLLRRGGSLNCQDTRGFLTTALLICLV
jgi:hypothetical protein